MLEQDLVASSVRRLATWWQPPLDLKVRLAGLLIDPLAFTQFDCRSLTNAVLWEEGERLAEVCRTWLEGAQARLDAVADDPAAE